MKYEMIDFSVEPESGEERLCCPVCGAVWVASEDGQPTVKNAACEHFMFIWQQYADEPSCFNGLTVEKLFAQIVAHYKASQPEVNWQDEHQDEIIEDIFFEQEIWESLKLDGVDTILEHTQSSMACGPSSYTVLFGVKTPEA